MGIYHLYNMKRPEVIFDLRGSFGGWDWGAHALLDKPLGRPYISYAWLEYNWSMHDKTNKQTFVFIKPSRSVPIFFFSIIEMLEMKILHSYLELIII